MVNVETTGSYSGTKPLKLSLKDQIAQIENILLPDIIA